MTDSIRDFFEGRAAGWNAMMPPNLSDILSAFTAPLAEEFRSARTILEIGTGTGALIPHLTALAPAARLISMDLAMGMLAQAQQRIPSAWLVQADAHNLPLPGAFDVVVCHNSFPHFTRPADALSEMRRVLRSGGQLFILHHLPRERVNQIHRQAGGAIGHDLLPAGSEMEQLLREAGFAAVQVEDTAMHYIARGKNP